MSMFVCDECGCIDNSALGGNWHNRFQNTKLFIGIKDNVALCAACTPATFKSGAPTKAGGVWHNQFPQKPWDGKAIVSNRRPGHKPN